jgi:fluoroacetyl-CoA thioesterase
MRPIPAGTRGIFSMQVKDRDLASQFKDAILPDVFATPMMVLAMENAALNAIRPYLDPGESAVGVEINVKHLAATPAGHRIEAEAVVTGVHGRRIEFTVSARDETEEIGRGTHARMAVDLERLKKRLDAKRGATALRAAG